MTFYKYDIIDNPTILFTNLSGGQDVCNDIVRIRQSIILEGEALRGIQEKAKVLICLPG